MKHFKDGEFHKDFDRRTTVSSFINFLRDPTGDLPWEEDESGADVVHIRDSEVNNRNKNLALTEYSILKYVFFRC